MHGTSGWLAAAVFAALGLAAAPGGAQQVDKAGAELLFDQGRRLVEESRFAEACPKFEQSQQLDPGVGTLLNLADCYEHLGRTASAWTTYREAAAGARAAGQADREQFARERAQALEPRLSRLVVRVAAPVPDLEVRTRGAKLSSALYGQALPVDPGDLVVEALAPGRAPWTRTVRIPDDGGTVEVEVPDPDGKPSASSPSVLPVAGPPAVPPAGPEPDADVPPDDGSTQRLAGWLVAGAGVAGLGVGGVFGLLAMSDDDASKEHCAVDDPNYCEAEGVSLRQSAQTKGLVSTIAFAAGAAAVAGGFVLVLTAPSASSAASAPRVVAAPAVGPRDIGFILRGAL